MGSISQALAQVLARMATSRVPQDHTEQARFQFLPRAGQGSAAGLEGLFWNSFQTDRGQEAQASRLFSSFSRFDVRRSLVCELNASRLLHRRVQRELFRGGHIFFDWWS